MFNEFLNGEFAYNCRTPNDTLDLFDKLMSLNIKWADSRGSEYTLDNFLQNRDCAEENTCYFFNKRYNGLQVASVDYFKKDSVDIVVYITNPMLVEME